MVGLKIARDCGVGNSTISRFMTYGEGNVDKNNGCGMVQSNLTLRSGVMDLERMFLLPRGDESQMVSLA